MKKLRYDLCTVLTIAVASRAFYILVAYVSSRVFAAYDKSTLLVDRSFFSFLLRWDAINFYTIASRSYLTEHTLAFFPLYPALVSALSRHAGMGILLSGIAISNACFCLSALVLYLLSVRRYTRRVCMLSVVFFCFNPSSIVYCTMYAESLFALLFLLSFFCLETRSCMFALFSGLCSITRSNGILFVAFSPFNYRFLQLLPVVLVQLLPFVFFQVYALVLVGERRLYLPYSDIQSKYWDQGFLRFYMDPKNIANCAVAFPFVSFCVYLLLSYAFTYRKRCKNTILLMVILLTQTLMAVFFIHAQIFARFVSFNPIIYWSLAHMAEKNGFSGTSLVNAFYFTYGVAYAVLFGAYYPPA